MASPVLLSILIVNWNVRDLVRACLQSVRQQSLLPAEQYEIIVLDNDSHDGSVDMLRQEFPDVTLLVSDVNLGFAAGCNRAYAQARGDYILLLNPDTEVLDHGLDRLLATLRDRPQAAVVGPRLVRSDGSFQRDSAGALPRLANTAWNYLFLQQLLPARLAPPALFLADDVRELRPIEWVSGASMMLRRQALGATIFDEAFFMFGEDMDLCHRMRQAGWQVLYDGTTSVLHHHGSSFDQQDSLAVLATAHRGPRRVFAQRHGRLSLLVYDGIVLLGFGIRWPLYALLDVLRPGRGYGQRSVFSRRYLQAALQERGRPLPQRKA